MFMVIASLLSVFNIGKDDGSDSKADDIYPSTGGGIMYGHRVGAGMTRKVDLFLLSVPSPFTCSILPRDRKAEELIVANTQAQ
jgi:hypothetical protein